MKGLTETVELVSRIGQATGIGRENSILGLYIWPRVWGEIGVEPSFDVSIGVTVVVGLMEVRDGGHSGAIGLKTNRRIPVEKHTPLLNAFVQHQGGSSTADDDGFSLIGPCRKHAGRIDLSQRCSQIPDGFTRRHRRGLTRISDRRDVAELVILTIRRTDELKTDFTNCDITPEALIIPTPWCSRPRIGCRRRCHLSTPRQRVVAIEAPLPALIRHRHSRCVGLVTGGLWLVTQIVQVQPTRVGVDAQVVGNVSLGPRGTIPHQQVVDHVGASNVIEHLHDDLADIVRRILRTLGEPRVPAPLTIGTQWEILILHHASEHVEELHVPLDLRVSAGAVRLSPTKKVRIGRSPQSAAVGHHVIKSSSPIRSQ